LDKQKENEANGEGDDDDDDDHDDKDDKDEDEDFGQELEEWERKGWLGSRLVFYTVSDKIFKNTTLFQYFLF
jgi:hypothetical protein